MACQFMKNTQLLRPVVSSLALGLLSSDYVFPGIFSHYTGRLYSQYFLRSKRADMTSFDFLFADGVNKMQLTGMQHQPWRQFSAW